MKPTSQSVCRDSRQIDQQSNYILVNSKLAELNKPPQSVIPDSCLCLLDSSHTDKHTHTYTHTHTHTSKTQEAGVCPHRYILVRQIQIMDSMFIIVTFRFHVNSDDIRML